MNIRDFKYVVAVADELHFGRAAAKCHVSQPALSGQLRKLEGQLGVVLFERTNRAVRITPIGERIAAQARQLITLSEEIAATAKAAADPFSGEFRLGMISTIGPYLAPRILPSIRGALPDLSLTLVEGFTAGLEERVAKGDLDGAILATPPADPHLQELPLYNEPFRIALYKDHPLAGRKSVELGEIDRAALLLLADGHCLRDQVMEVCDARTGSAHANTRETSLETLLALVAAGDGVTLLPALTAPGEAGGRNSIVTRPEASGTAGRTVRLVCRASFPGVELVGKLASIIRAEVPEALVRVLN